MTAKDRWEAHDRYGNKIYMTAERWEHILGRRPWMESLRGKILDTLRHGWRKQNLLNPSQYKYYWPCHDLLPDFNHLVVVVIFGWKEDDTGQAVPNNYVVTGWAVFTYGRG